MEEGEWIKFNMDNCKRISLKQTLLGVLSLLLGLGISMEILAVTKGWEGQIFVNLIVILTLLVSIFFMGLFFKSANYFQKEFIF
ncbi:hypothetical protein [Lactococcus lactis]|uniref:hypothetical protein n=1 Tax=Lactococcus lactis TaxID=1358 RepID=UPI001912910C|nr:hypothetical protein [Lactococcus lactis]WDA67511.1 hypothetical protein IL310_01140 [Lactococcus lactis]WDA67530.1 hypothetical protein IL310_01235 [Lactococcus lactis]